MRIFFPVGILAGLFGVFFGATGPLTAPFYIRNDILKGELIATKATCQTAVHIVNLILFGSIGVNIFVYWKLLVCLSVFVIMGTLVGKKLLNRLSFKTFIFWFKLVLTIIAARIVVLQVHRLIYS